MRAALQTICIVLLLYNSATAQNKEQLKIEKQLLMNGKLLYEKYSCKSCHGDKGVLQGDLTKSYLKYSNEQLKSYIKNPHAYNNFRMPVYEQIIPEKDYENLVLYVRHLGESAGKLNAAKKE